MSAGEVLKQAHRKVAGGAGQIALMLETQRISRAALEEALSSIEEGAETIRALVHPKVKEEVKEEPEKVEEVSLLGVQPNPEAKLSSVEKPKRARAKKEKG